MSALTAVVHDAQGVRFAATARSERELEAQIIEYIRSRCDYVLWPRIAAGVHELIARDRAHDAIATYFANVGRRWDHEWLEVSDGDMLQGVA